jgi:hypothetical protein
MDRLFEDLLKQKFATKEAAIDCCRDVCLESGFDIKYDTTANRVSMYFKHFL